jgi:hypothetical protein
MMTKESNRRFDVTNKAWTTRVLKDTLASGDPDSRHSIITVTSTVSKAIGKTHTAHAFRPVFFLQRIMLRSDYYISPEHKIVLMTLTRTTQWKCMSEYQPTILAGNFTILVKDKRSDLRSGIRSDLQVLTVPSNSLLEHADCATQRTLDPFRGQLKC